jgi:hypothetical protein
VPGFATNSNSNNTYCTYMCSDPMAGTAQCDADHRYRARYDYGANTGQNTTPDRYYTYGTNTCLNIVGKAVSTVDTPGGRWAEAVGQHPPGNILETTGCDRRRNRPDGGSGNVAQLRDLGIDGD